jgi:hypothetical protein
VEDAVKESHVFSLKSEEALRELAVEPFGEDEIGGQGGQKGGDEVQKDSPSFENIEEAGHQEKGGDEIPHCRHDRGIGDEKQQDEENPRPKPSGERNLLPDHLLSKRGLDEQEQRENP